MINPLVTISCITYNHGKYIRECLDGFISQKVDFPFEIVIYDDASSDQTQEIIREFEEKYPNLIFPIYQTENQWSKGVKPTWEFNKPRWRGKYIAFCEGDDFWSDPFKLHKQVKFLEENPGYSGCCTNFSEIDEYGKLLKEFSWSGLKLEPKITQEIVLELYKPKLLTTLFRSEIFVSEFPEIFFKVFNADNFLCAIATNYGPIGFMNFNSGSYRVHNQGIWSGKTEIRQFEMQLDTFQKMLSYFTKGHQKKAILNRIYKTHRTLSRLYAKELEFGKSMNQLKIIFSVDPKDTMKAFLGNLVAPVYKAFS